MKPWRGSSSLRHGKAASIALRLGGGLGCLLILVFLVLVGPGLLFVAMLVAGSQRTIYARAVSPDGAREARVQFDDAGAATAYQRIVFVKRRWIPSDSPWLSCEAFAAQGEAAVQLRWRDDRTLLIQHGFAPAAVYGVASHCGPVRIVVQAVGRETVEGPASGR